VDVVLGAPYGETVTASLEILRAFGTFVDFGKRASYEGGALPLAPFLKGLAYRCAHIDVLMLEDRPAAARLLRQVWRALPALPALPVVRFPLADLGLALGYMAKGVHSGKILVENKGGFSGFNGFNDDLGGEGGGGIKAVQVRLPAAGQRGGPALFSQVLGPRGDPLLATLMPFEAKPPRQVPRQASEQPPEEAIGEAPGQPASSEGARHKGGHDGTCSGDGSLDGSPDGSPDGSTSAAGSSSSSSLCGGYDSDEGDACLDEEEPVAPGPAPARALAVHVVPSLAHLSAVLPRFARFAHPPKSGPGSSAAAPAAAQGGEETKSADGGAIDAAGGGGGPAHAEVVVTASRAVASLIGALARGAGRGLAVVRLTEWQPLPSALPLALGLVALHAAASGERESRRGRGGIVSGTGGESGGESRGERKRGDGGVEGVKRGAPAVLVAVASRAASDLGAGSSAASGGLSGEAAVQVFEAWLATALLDLGGHAESSSNPSSSAPPKAGLDLGLEFEALGVDSLAQIGLARRVGLKLGLPGFGVLDLLKHPTPNALIDLARAKSGTGPAQPAGPAGATVALGAPLSNAPLPVPIAPPQTDRPWLGAAPRAPAAEATILSGLGGGAKRGRILCLHGYRSSPDVLQVGLAEVFGGGLGQGLHRPPDKLARELEGLELEFLAAPHRSSGAGEPGIPPEVPTYEWWGRPGASFAEGWKSLEPRRVRASLEAALAAVSGGALPVVGLVGFSQGAALAAALAARPDVRSQGLRWVALFSAVPLREVPHVPRSPKVQSGEEEVDLPSFHCFDPEEGHGELCREVMNLFEAGQKGLPESRRRRVLCEHSQGHRPPKGSDAAKTRALLGDFIAAATNA